MWVGCKLVQTGLQGNAPTQWGPLESDSTYSLSVTARAFCCKHLKWEWDLVELVLPGHQPKDVTTHRWSQLPFYPLHLHLVSSEQELLPCDSDAFIEWTAMQMAISGIETVTLRCKGVWRWSPSQDASIGIMATCYQESSFAWDPSRGPGIGTPKKL